MTKLVFIGQLAKEQLNVIFFYSLVQKYFDIIFVPPMNCKKKKKATQFWSNWSDIKFSDFDSNLRVKNQVQV